MSLEQQIGALVKASENLTGAVNGKIGEIDKKVNIATSAVPEQIRKNMYVTRYVDASNGDDSRSGESKSNAKRSVQSALDSAPVGSVIWCSLQNGQEHQISSRIPCLNKTIIFSPWIYSSDRPTLRAVSYVEDGKCLIGTIMEPSGFHCYYVDVVIDDYFDTDSPVDGYRKGFLSNGDRPISPNITIATGNLTHAGFPFVHSAGRPTLVSALLFNCTYTRRDSKRGMTKMIESVGGALYLTNFSMSNATHVDLINLTRDKYGVVTNWNSNFDFAAAVDGV
ncbi:hypothetical protein [Photobacterium iliopiscarium]|uniref:hypothetical protein n=1 Tax=Photobacterium iliopiscarium TaxID=56192 RepID=UPI001E3D2F52|nr:hypothetical protein [Photobacterium iliopiscarium]MCD9468548.1 hypothetical protein [Photobacterium iliopiscarium]MCD9488568.1 hypothetical protein [Photobacterium iliopiscarium]MCF2245301.1 hypothetical protein [Photobacterium iliopiscarium]